MYHEYPQSFTLSTMESSYFDNLHVLQQHQRLISPAIACLSLVTAQIFQPFQAINQSVISYHVNRT